MRLFHLIVALTANYRHSKDWKSRRTEDKVLKLQQ